jgi:integrase
MSELLLDRAGRRRSPATMPGFHAGRSPRNKGLRYPADPPKLEEIIAVMRAAGADAHGRRLRGVIVILWRAGLRIQEVLALAEGDLDQRRGALLVRRGKGGRRREVGMDAWGWEELHLGSSGGSSSLSGRCSASSTVRHAAGTGRAKRQSGQKVSRPPARMDRGRRAVRLPRVVGVWGHRVRSGWRTGWPLTSSGAARCRGREPSSLSTGSAEYWAT